MPIQKILAKVGVGKQTAKGSPLANPTYGFGITAGGVLTVELEQALEERTLLQRVAAGVNRLGFSHGAEFTTRAFPRSIPLLVYGVLGQIASTGPIAGIFTHTITPADDLPYLSIFGRQGGDYARVADAKIDELTLSWEDRNPLEVELKALGTTLLLGAAWTETTDETAQTYFGPIAGTFKVDTGSAAPVVAPVRAGEISIANNLAGIALSRSVEADDVFPGAQEITCALTLVPANLDEWRKIVTGSAGGTAVAAAPVYGSLDLKFLDGSNELAIVANRVAFTAGFPEADPGGGAVELEVEGMVVRPTDGSAAITVTAKNTVASY